VRLLTFDCGAKKKNLFGPRRHNQTGTHASLRGQRIMFQFQVFQTVVVV
jgi:hypothetical protein